MEQLYMPKHTQMPTYSCPISAFIKKPSIDIRLWRYFNTVVGTNYSVAILPHNETQTQNANLCDIIRHSLVYIQIHHKVVR